MYRLAKLMAAAAYLAVGVGGLFLCVRWVLGALGAAAAVGAALLFPVTLAVVPWIAALTDGAWAPLLVVYGGTFAAGALHALARAMERGHASEADGGAGPGRSGPSAGAGEPGEGV